MNASQKNAKSVFSGSAARKAALISFFLLCQLFVFAEMKSAGTQNTVSGSNSVSTQGSSAASSAKAVAGSGRVADSLAHDSTAMANSAARDVKPEGENVFLEVGVSVAVIVVICVLTWMFSGPRKGSPVKKGEEAKNGGARSSAK